MQEEEPIVLLEESLADLEGQHKFGQVLYHLYEGMFPSQRGSFYWQGARWLFEQLSWVNMHTPGVYETELPKPFRDQPTVWGPPTHPRCTCTGSLRVTLSNPRWHRKWKTTEPRVEWWEGEGKCRVRVELFNLKVHSILPPPKPSLWQRASDWFEAATHTSQS